MSDCEFYRHLAEEVARFDGYLNAHLHLDRSHTLAASERDKSTSHLALRQKHALISDVHASPWYSTENLSARLNKSLDQMIRCNTRRADSVIDVTADGLGLRAFETALGIAKDRVSEIELRCAVYSPLGFRDDEPERWDLIEQGAKMADFIGCLPERDDQIDYPEHIGYRECCRRMLDLAQRTGLDLQIHTDQVNHPNERGTEQVLDAIEAGSFGFADRDVPQVWVVHMISPSRYPEARWDRLVERLKAANVGVICCPSAAIGMRQVRGVNTPTGNSIARILELSAAGVVVRLGSDNISDMLSPSTGANLTHEVFMLSAALRFYDVSILAKLACGQILTQEDRSAIQQFLEANDAQMAKTIRRWSSVDAS